jgi:LuxR family maltose regulon positive regulatory protein
MMPRRVNDPLFLTKFAPPRGMHPILKRPKLLEKLDKPDVRLIVVRAPAGFGKTTLLQQWYDEASKSNTASAWLTLDGSDNDPARLVTGLTHAIQQGLAMTSDASASRHERDDMAFEGLLATVNHPLLLVLDDIDRIEAEGARSVIRMLLRMAAPAVKIVIAGRDIPSLGQAGLRVSGVVCDLDVDDLRFDRFETSAFLSQRLEDPLSNNQLEDIHEGTGGWVAALQLASLASIGTSSPDAPLKRRSTTVLDRSIAEYLQDDVLERQLPEIQEFLRRICVLSTLTGDLCNALTGRSDGEAKLVHLDFDGLLLKRVETNDGRVWYRFHAIFEDFLRNIAGSLPNATRARLHDQAARWFEERGMIAEAAQHAFLAGHPDRAYALLDSVAMEHIWQGRLNTVLDWSKNMTAAQAHEHPRLFTASLWAEGFAGDPVRASERLDAFLQRRIGKAASPSDVFMVDTLYCMPILLAAARADYHFLTALPPDALERLTQDDSYEYAALANTLGYTNLALGRPGEAQALLLKAEAACQVKARSYNLAFTYLFDGMRQLSVLELPAAVASLREGYARVNREHTELSQSAALVGCVLADALFENGEHDAAMMLVDRHLPMIADALPDCIILYYLVAFRIAVTAKDLVRAGELVEELDACGTRRRSELILRSAMAFRAVVALASGSTIEAVSLAKQLAAKEAVLDQRMLPPVEALVRDIFVLRVQAVTEPSPALCDRIAALADAADAHRSDRRATQLRLLHMQVADRVGQRRDADKSRADVEARADAMPFARSFTDEGRHILALAAEYAQSGQTSAKPTSSESIPTPKSGNAELEGLTHRERDILSTVARGLTNREIAECFSLSETTVKWHLRNVFSKLGVGNRTEAAFYGNLL